MPEQPQSPETTNPNAGAETPDPALSSIEGPALQREFEQLIRQLPPAHRPAFLTHLRHHPPPHRLFLHHDTTGHPTLIVDPCSSGDAP
jgi:hypothetical protein